MNIALLALLIGTAGLIIVALLWHFLKPSDTATELFYAASHGDPRDHDSKFQWLSFLGYIALGIFALGIFFSVLYTFGIDINITMDTHAVID